MLEQKWKYIKGSGWVWADVYRLSDKDIFIKAIEIAISNGANLRSELISLDYVVVLSHDFAKSFWGEEEYHVPSGRIKAWQDNLQQMVLYENPIDYLRKFIK